MPNRFLDGDAAVARRVLHFNNFEWEIHVLKKAKQTHSDT